MATVSRGGRQLSSPDVFANQTAIAAQNAQQARALAAERGKDMLDRLEKYATDSGYSVSQIAQLQPELFKSAYRDLQGGLDFGGRADMMLAQTQQGPVTADQFRKFESDRSTKDVLAEIKASLESGEGQVMAPTEETVTQAQQTTGPRLISNDEAREIGARVGINEGSWSDFFSALGQEPVSGSKEEGFVWGDQAQEYRNNIVKQVTNKDSWFDLDNNEKARVVQAVRSGNITRDVVTETTEPTGVQMDREKQGRIEKFIRSTYGEDSKQSAAAEALRSATAFGQLRDEEQKLLSKHLESLATGSDGLSVREDRFLSESMKSRFGIDYKDLPVEYRDMFTGGTTTETTQEVTPLVFGGIEAPGQAIAVEQSKNIKQDSPIKNAYTDIWREVERAYAQQYPENMGPLLRRFQEDTTNRNAKEAQTRYNNAMAMRMFSEQDKVKSSLNPNDLLYKTIETYNEDMQAFLTGDEDITNDSEKLKNLFEFSAKIEEGLRLRGIPANAMALPTKEIDTSWIPFVGGKPAKLNLFFPPSFAPSALPQGPAVGGQTTDGGGGGAAALGERFNIKQ